MKGASKGGAESGRVALIPSPADDLLSTSQRSHIGPVLPPPSRCVCISYVLSCCQTHVKKHFTEGKGEGHSTGQAFKHSPPLFF